jgi:hypothetical protein
MQMLDSTFTLAGWDRSPVGITNVVLLFDASYEGTPATCGLFGTWPVERLRAWLLF